MNEKPRCPYCGENDAVVEWFNDGYRCIDCNYVFDKEEAEWEDLRRQLKVFLAGTDEEHPIECRITIGHDEAMGLSELELPTVIKCFEDYEGIIWFFIEGTDDYVEIDEPYYFSPTDLKDIINGLKEL